MENRDINKEALSLAGVSFSRKENPCGDGCPSPTPATTWLCFLLRCGRKLVYAQQPELAED
jgi:hypothetical protein